MRQSGNNPVGARENEAKLNVDKNADSFSPRSFSSDEGDVANPAPAFIPGAACAEVLKEAGTQISYQIKNSGPPKEAKADPIFVLQKQMSPAQDPKSLKSTWTP